MSSSLTHNVTRVDLGPLTTVFTPPEACATLSVAAVDGSNFISQWGWSCSDRFYSGTTVDGTSISPETIGYLINEPSCYPSAQASVLARSDIWTSLPIYSPGSECPQGFTSAITISRQPGQPSPTRGYDYVVWDLLRDGETAVGCCLSGLEAETDYFAACQGWPTVGQVYSGLSRTGTDGCGTPTMTTITVTQEPDRGVYIANGVFQVIMIVGSSIDTLANSPSMATSNVHSSTDLSLGAKIGIGVAVPLFVICSVAATCAAVMIKRYRRRKRTQQQPQGDWRPGPGMSNQNGQYWAAPAINNQNGQQWTAPGINNQNGQYWTAPFPNPQGPPADAALKPPDVELMSYTPKPELQSDLRAHEISSSQ